MINSSKIPVINYHINKKTFTFVVEVFLPINTMNTRHIIRNFIYAVAGGILSLGTVGCSGNKAETTDSFSTLETQFSNPSSEFRTAPFMVWNGKVTEAEIDRMLKDFKDAGCGGAFIHPRPGMITEYMSDEWYSLYRYAVDKGKEMGLDIWDLR